MEEDRLYAWGRRIRAFRKLKGYTQKELACALHVSVSVLGAVERGYKAPSPEFLAEIAQVLEVDLQELKGDMDQENGERGDNDDASNRPY